MMQYNSRMRKHNRVLYGIDKVYDENKSPYDVIYSRPPLLKTIYTHIVCCQNLQIAIIIHIGVQKF